MITVDQPLWASIIRNSPYTVANGEDVIDQRDRGRRGLGTIDERSR
jgi:hypothetical protein